MYGIESLQLWCYSATFRNRTLRTSDLIHRKSGLWLWPHPTLYRKFPVYLVSCIRMSEKLLLVLLFNQAAHWVTGRMIKIWVVSQASCPRAHTYPDYNPGLTATPASGFNSQVMRGCPSMVDCHGDTWPRLEIGGIRYLMTWPVLSAQFIPESWGAMSDLQLCACVCLRQSSSLFW